MPRTVGLKTVSKRLTIILRIRPGNEDRVEHGGENAIANPEIIGIEVYVDGSYCKDGHSRLLAYPAYDGHKSRRTRTQ